MLESKIFQASLGAVLGLTFLAIGAVIGARLGAFSALKGILRDMSGKGSPGSSPVRVVGGSMTFHGKGGWKLADKTCKPGDPLDTCPYVAAYHFPVATPPTSVVADDFDNHPASAPIGSNWQINLYAYAFDGNSIYGYPAALGDTGTPALQLCSTGDDMICGSGTGVLLKSLSPTNGVYPVGKDLPPSFDKISPREGKRFHGSKATGCNLAIGEFCEHLAAIVVTGDVSSPTNTTTIRCPGGHCVIKFQ